MSVTGKIETKRRNKKGAAPDCGGLRPVKRSYFFFAAAGADFTPEAPARRARSSCWCRIAREFFHASGGVDKFLLTGEKGMAGRANAEAEILFGGAGVIDRAAGADDSGFPHIRGDIGFHGSRKWYLNSSGEQAPFGAAPNGCFGRIQKSRDRAENDHEAGAQKRHDRNHDDGDNGQYQAYSTRVCLSCGTRAGKQYEKGFDDGSHLWRLRRITLQNTSMD